MSNPNERPGVDTIPFGQGRTAVRLYGFPTSSAALQHEHLVYLRQWVERNYNRSARYDLVGLASFLPFRDDSDGQNTQLSLQRARAVEAYILRQMVQIESRTPRRRGHIFIPDFEVTVRGAGTGWNVDGGSGPDDEGHRSVLIIETPYRELPSQRIDPAVPGLTEHRRFRIKCLGTASGGLVLGGSLAMFVIRDPANWYQEYHFGSLTAGIGAPVQWGDPMPGGRGWMPFRTREVVRVDRFSGPAQTLAGGVSVPEAGGLTLAQITFAYGKGPLHHSNPLWCRADIRTGGFAFGIGADVVGYLWKAETAPRHDNAWRRL